MKRILFSLVTLAAIICSATSYAQVEDFQKLQRKVNTLCMEAEPDSTRNISVTMLQGDAIRQLTKADPKDKSLVENRLQSIYQITIKGQVYRDVYLTATRIAGKSPFQLYTAFQNKAGTQYHVYKIEQPRKSEYMVLISDTKSSNCSVSYIIGDLKPADVLSLLNINKEYNNDISLYTRGKVYNVSYESFNHDPQLDITIDSIEFTDEATIMQVTMYFKPNYWIRFGDEHLWANGIQYKLQSVDKCALGEKYVMPASGKQSFTLTFPPINAKVTTMDWKGITADSWKIIGIKIDSPVK